MRKNSNLGYMKKWIAMAVAVLLALATSRLLAQNAAAKVDWPAMGKLLSSARYGKPLAQAGLSPSELKAVRAALKRLANGPGCEGAYIQSCGAEESEFLERVKITPDGKTAVVLRSKTDCGTLGCPFWMIEPVGEGRVLLDDFGWGYALLPSSEHGYFDVVTAAGNHQVGLAWLRFDGKEYAAFRCATADANDDAGPALLHITEHACATATP
jgi:hypothetical protein